jgi:quercetin dioxygenase-like cupin family protein
MAALNTVYPRNHCHPPRSAERIGFLRSIGFVIGSLDDDFSSTNKPNHRSPGMKREKAISTLQVDDGKVRVTRWDFSPGAETGWHTHGMDYVVVPLTDGTLSAELLDGSTVENQLTIGSSYARSAGVEHNIVNASRSPFSFIEVEFK